MRSLLSKICKPLWPSIVFFNLVILFIVVRNIFPSGFIYSNGDVSQYFQFDHILKFLGYTWDSINGQGNFLVIYSSYIFYFPIYLISRIFHLSPSAQSLLYFSIILFGSFWSFYLAGKIFLNKETRFFESKKYLAVFAFLYAVNGYTLYNFMSTSWGYQHFLTMYIIFPIAFVLIHLFFTSKRSSQYLAYCGIIFFFLNVSNSNFAFFISFNLLLLFLIVGYWVIFKYKFSQILAKTIQLYLVLLLATCWTVIPQIGEMLNMAKGFSSSQSVWDLGGWILWQSLPFIDIYAMTWGITDQAKFIWPGLAGSFILVVSFVYLIRKNLEKNIVLLLSAASVFIFFLENKGKGWLPDKAILLIFNNPLLGSIRSVDKTIIYTPFLIIFVLFILLPLERKWTKYLLPAILIIVAISVFPFYRGNLYENYPKSSLRGTEYKSVVKIPQEYLEASQLINSDNLDAKIGNGPYGVINSIGWMNYPMWQMFGVDPTTQLYNKPSVYMNNVGVYGAWNYGEEWNKSTPEDSKWLLYLYGQANIKYFIFHKDSDPQFVQRAHDKILFYEKSGWIKKLQTNQYFDLFEIGDEFFLPHFYLPQSVVGYKDVEEFKNQLNASSDAATAYFKLSDLKNANISDKEMGSQNDTAAVEYKKINPTRYNLVIHNIKGKIPLVFSESFNRGWQLSATNTGATVNKDSVQPSNSGSDSATENELNGYLAGNLISKTGKSFVSKNIHHVIQNDNLDNGTIFDILFGKNITADHLKVNEYANSWMINPETICKDQPAICTTNQDGSYDVSLILSFEPQKYYYITLFISSLTLLTSILFAFKIHRSLKKIK